MKRIIFALIFLALLVGLASLIPNDPGTAYPINTPLPPAYEPSPYWAGYDCGYPSRWIHVRWVDPPPPVLPFNTGTNKGWLTLYYGSNSFSYRWEQYSHDYIQGHDVYNWTTHVTIPDGQEFGQDYYLSGWVHNLAGGDYWMEPLQFTPPCWQFLPKIFLPYVNK